MRLPPSLLPLARWLARPRRRRGARGAGRRLAALVPALAATVLALAAVAVRARRTPAPTARWTAMRPCAPTDHDRWQRLRDNLRCSPISRRACFNALLALLEPWPLAEGRAEAWREAEAVLATWPAEDRVADVQYLVDRRTGAVASTVRLVRGLREWYPDDTAMDHGWARDALLRSPLVRELDALQFVRVERPFGPVFDSPTLERVRSLAVYDAIEPLDTARLARWRALAHLEALSVSEVRVDGAALVAVLAGAPRFRDLRLRCGGACLARLLGEPALLGRLERLDVSGGALHDEGVALLASHAPALRRLEFLGLASTGMGDAGVARLIEARSLDRLRELDVRGNPAISVRARCALRAAPQFADTEILFPHPPPPPSCRPPAPSSSLRRGG